MLALSSHSRELKDGPRGRRRLTSCGQMSGWHGALAAETVPVRETSRLDRSQALSPAFRLFVIKQHLWSL